MQTAAVVIGAAVILVLAFICIGIYNVANAVGDASVQLERMSILMTVLANKQGCTEEDINEALGKTKKNKKVKLEKGE